MKEPIVIDPPNFNIQAAWQECREYVDKCGGMTHEDGDVNWRAAFGADPGVCSCPACHQMYWAWGKQQRCVDCGFEYPTDWWAMYSWGVQAERRQLRDSFPDKLHQRRMAHPYYRYGFEHPVDDPWKHRDQVDWKQVMAEENVNDG